MRDVIRRQQELTTSVDGTLSRHRQGRGKNSIKKSSWCKSLLGRRLRVGISERYTAKTNEKAPKKLEGTLHDYGSAPVGTVL